MEEELKCPVCQELMIEATTDYQLRSFLLFVLPPGVEKDGKNMSRL